MSRHTKKRRRRAGQLLVGAAMSAGTVGVAMLPADATPRNATPRATTAAFSRGVLTVLGDAAPNIIVISRDANGTILVNGGAVPVRGQQATVTNTDTIQVFAGAGDDTVTLDETNGPLPNARLFGGTGNDTLTGGSGGDLLFGQAGDDVLLGKGGNDMLFGSAGNDVLTGGRGNDQVFGEDGDDRLIWNPGDGSAVNEGGDGADTVEVNGGNASEQFTETANGTRVRFDRLNVAPFTLDIGTSENLVLNMNGGDDSFTATGNLAPLIATSVDGGAGNDTISGTNGADRLLGGDGSDVIDGQQGNDLALLGAGDDTFQWDPGDGSDTVEGQDGTDTMVFNGANIDENIDLSANGQRLRLFRNVGNVTMDTDDVENVVVNAFGGADNVVVNDLTGTDVVAVTVDVTAAGGVDDNAADNVTVRGTEGDDVAVVNGQGPDLQVDGLHAAVSVIGGSAATDTLTVETGAGDDVIAASGVAADTATLIFDGGAGDDVLVGGDGDDTLLGGDGDDVLIGGPGTDVLDGGAGSNILIQGESLTNGTEESQQWLDAHVRTEGDHDVLDLGDRQVTLPPSQSATDS